ncbi:hypothetical protein KAI92_05180 [Candidatus Parcubacteria bacterium]|nr:hypothetical protein [Candidatus Parcubacteria bacterium]
MKKLTFVLTLLVSCFLFCKSSALGEILTVVKSNDRTVCIVKESPGEKIEKTYVEVQKGFPETINSILALTESIQNENNEYLHERKSSIISIFPFELKQGEKHKIIYDDEKSILGFNKISKDDPELTKKVKIALGISYLVILFIFPLSFIGGILLELNKKRSGNILILTTLLLSIIMASIFINTLAMFILAIVFAIGSTLLFMSAGIVLVLASKEAPEFIAPSLMFILAIAFLFLFVFIITLANITIDMMFIKIIISNYILIMLEIFAIYFVLKKELQK